jgi:hypothetical protein
MQNKFALAVEIDTNTYEIFDVFFFENIEMSQRYSKAISAGAIGILAPDYNNIKIGATLVDNKFIVDNQEGILSFSENDVVYTLLSENKVFGISIINKNTDRFIKYDAAFENDVIVLDVSNEDSVGFGDIWDSNQKIILKY